MPKATPTTPISDSLVVSSVLAILGVSPEQFRSDSRHPRYVLARRLAARLLRECTFNSWPSIARIMGRPNHSSVIDAYQRLDHLLALPRGHADRAIRIGEREIDIQTLLDHLRIALSPTPSHPDQETALP